MDIKEIVGLVKAGKLDEGKVALKAELTSRSTKLIAEATAAIQASLFENEVFNDPEARSKQGSAAAADHTKAAATIVPHGGAPHEVEPEPVEPNVKKVPGISTTEKVPGYKAPKVNNNTPEEPGVKKVPGASTTDVAPGLGDKANTL